MNERFFPNLGKQDCPNRESSLLKDTSILDECVVVSRMGVSCSVAVKKTDYAGVCPDPRKCSCASGTKADCGKYFQYVASISTPRKDIEEVAA